MVKMLRKQYNLTQEELSLKSGVGLRLCVILNKVKRHCASIRRISFSISSIMKWLLRRKNNHQ